MKYYPSLLLLFTGFMGSFLLNVFAADGEFNNLCAYGLTGGQSIKTTCVISEVIGKKTYCFGTQEAKVEFLKDQTNNILKASNNFLEIQTHLDDDLDDYSPLAGTATKNNDEAKEQLQRRIDRNIVTPGGRDDKELEWEIRRDN